MKKTKIKVERRGRKRGGGIIQNIDHKSSGLERMMKLAYGSSHGNRFSETVRWFRALRVMKDDLAYSENEEVKQRVDMRTSDLVARLHQQMGNALYDFNPDWFQNMADAIRTEKEASKNPIYPIHIALLRLALVPLVDRLAVVFPERTNSLPPMNSTPIFTFDEVCKWLKKLKLRPEGQGDDSWQVTVRRACKHIGFPLLAVKPGPKRRKL